MAGAQVSCKDTKLDFFQSSKNKQTMSDIKKTDSKISLF